MVIGHDEVVAARLARGVGRARIVGRLLGEIARVAQGAEDLVGADMVEQDIAAPLPGAPRLVEEGKGAHHVGPDEGFGAEDGPVHVALRRESGATASGA